MKPVFIIDGKVFNKALLKLPGGDIIEINADIVASLFPNENSEISREIAEESNFEECKGTLGIDSEECIEDIRR